MIVVATRDYVLETRGNPLSHEMIISIIWFGSTRILGNNDNRFDGSSNQSMSKKGDDEDVLEIVVPEGVRSGQTISIKDPRNGKIYRVCVPLGAGPGTKIQLNTS